MAGARVKLEQFGGMIPRASNRLLPPSHAQIARNVKLQSGEIRGLREPKLLHDFGDTDIVKVYRLPDPAGVDGETWVGFDSRDIDMFRGPLLNDAYDRFYKFGGGLPPSYNTLERIRNGDSWYWLGVPEPPGAITVTPSGGSASDIDRYYVYTFVSPYGEEGPPSSPVGATGAPDGTWAIAGMSTTVPEQANRADGFTKRLYRTVVGFTAVEFFFVADIPLANATYNDTITDDVVSRNAILESEQWLAPATDIEGAIVMPNGFFVAWSGRDVHFCETYRPHAWPPAYDLSTEYDIIGAGVFGQSVALITTGNPYVGTGVAPQALTLTKAGTVEPGLSRYGIVSAPYGVLYPSQNGLMMVNPNGVQLSTQQLVTKNEWVTRYSPSTIWAAQYQTSYIAFYSPDDGFIIDPREPALAFSELDRFLNVEFIQTDPFSGDVFLTQKGKAYLWDSVDQPRVEYQWRSKEFTFPIPANIGAANIAAEKVDSLGNTALIESIQAWNEARMNAAPLDAIGMVPIGSSLAVALPPPHDVREQISQPFAGSPLVDIQSMVDTVKAFRLKVYAAGECIYSELYKGQPCIRLPSGLKVDTWSFEFLSRRDLYEFTAAETCKGLRDV